MPIEHGRGNLLAADVDALVNTVNTEGVMGKGLALQFKKAFPDAFNDYERACRKGEVQIGRIHVVYRLVSPRFIFNFPTKKHWRHPSKLEYIQDGLRDLVAQIQSLDVNSIAIPPLGCGNGGLAWSAVRRLIEEAFQAVPNVRVLLYAPTEAPPPDEIIDRRDRPRMTPSRAAVIALMGQYVETGYDYRLSLLEVQKLTYFLQAAGENLRLTFKPHHYGPYADDLRKSLRNIEGHYTRGVGDGVNKPETPIELLPGAVEEARTFLHGDPATRARLDRVASLIEGFETPFGMELLSTVHWVMHELANPSCIADIISGVHAWSDRKRSTFKDGHIRAAWARLCERDLTTVSAFLPA